MADYAAHEFPRRATGTLWKTTKTAAKAAKAKTRRETRTTEDRHKEAVRKRDLRRCRFPLCGCKRIKLQLEVSHDRHKGSGGNPAGDRSTPDRMILLCLERHQTGAFSRHAGTIRNRYLTKANNNGPIVWEARRSALYQFDIWAIGQLPDGSYGPWIELARERSVQVLEPLLPWQREFLEKLAEEMSR